MRRSTSLPSGLNLWNQDKENVVDFPLTPKATPTSSHTFTWSSPSSSDYRPLTPPPTPTAGGSSAFDEVGTKSPPSAARGWALGRAVRWLRNIRSEQTETVETEDSFSAFK